MDAFDSWWGRAIVLLLAGYVLLLFDSKYVSIGQHQRDIQELRDSQKEVLDRFQARAEVQAEVINDMKISLMRIETMVRNLERDRRPRPSVTQTSREAL